MSDYLPTHAKALIQYKKDKDFEQDFEQAEIRWVNDQGRSEKSLLPAYEDESPERLLFVVREFCDFCRSIELHTPDANGNESARSVYTFWSKTLKGAARDTWETVLSNHPIIDTNKTWQTFHIHVRYLYKEYFDKNAIYKQREYLKNTKKPKDMTVRQWIRRMKTINQYIDLIELGKKFTEEQLIEECITPNIPYSWKSAFMMGDGHTLASTNDVATKLAILEEFHNEHDNKHKRRNNGNSKQSKSSRGKRSDSQKFKNKCRKHPNGNHEWKDCILNPNSKNYKEDSHNNKKNKKHESNAISKKKSPKKTPNKNNNSDDETSDSDNGV